MAVSKNRRVRDEPCDDDGVSIATVRFAYETYHGVPGRKEGTEKTAPWESKPVYMHFDSPLAMSSYTN